MVRCSPEITKISALEKRVHDMLIWIGYKYRTLDIFIIQINDWTTFLHKQKVLLSCIWIGVMSE